MVEKVELGTTHREDRLPYADIVSHKTIQNSEGKYLVCRVPEDSKNVIAGLWVLAGGSVQVCEDGTIVSEHHSEFAWIDVDNKQELPLDNHSRRVLEKCWGDEYGRK